MSFHFQQKEKYFSSKIIQAGSGTHPTTNPAGTGILSQGLSCKGVNGATHVALVQCFSTAGPRPRTGP